MKRLRNKVIFVIILFFLIVSFYYILNYFTNIPIHEIQIMLEDEVTSIKSPSEVKHIISSFNTAKRVKSISIDDFIPFQCKIINTKNESSIKELFIDYDNSNVYLKESTNKLYKISEDYESFFLTHDAFNSIYKNSIPPNLRISFEERKIKHTTNIQWSFRKLDEVYYSSNAAIESNHTYKFTKEDTLKFEYSKKPLRVEYILYKDDSIVDSGELIENLFNLPDLNGNYRLWTKAIYDDELEGFKGVIESQIRFEMDLPAKFSISKTNIYQGDILRIDVKNLDSDETPFIHQNISELFSFSDITDGKAYGYIPISYKVKEGEYSLVYGVNDSKFGDLSINILPRDFNIQYLTVDKKVEKSTRNNAAYEEYYKYYLPTRYESNSEPYFEKPFIIPVKGRVSTEYGERRFVNNEPTSYHHAGLDIAAPTGTKVLASNSGKVKLSMFLTLTGNSIVIDHGNGFFSTYYHMEDRFVEEGNMVNIGDEIGTVGSTGFSTGPHLHFMISYYNQNLEPGYLIYNEPITYENYKTLFEIE